MRYIALVMMSALLASACSMTKTVPVAVISEQGQILRGSSTASLGGGSFSATDGQLTCSGTYDALSQSITISFPVLCSDGRKGLGTATREAGLQAGSGTVRLSDGSSWTFVFGKSATSF